MGFDGIGDQPGIFDNPSMDKSALTQSSFPSWRPSLPCRRRPRSARATRRRTRRAGPRTSTTCGARARPTWLRARPGSPPRSPERSPRGRRSPEEVRPGRRDRRGGPGRPRVRGRADRLPHGPAIRGPRGPGRRIDRPRGHRRLSARPPAPRTGGRGTWSRSPTAWGRCRTGSNPWNKPPTGRSVLPIR